MHRTACTTCTACSTRGPGLGGAVRPAFPHPRPRWHRVPQVGPLPVEPCRPLQGGRQCSAVQLRYSCCTVMGGYTTLWCNPAERCAAAPTAGRAGRGGQDLHADTVLPVPLYTCSTAGTCSSPSAPPLSRTREAWSSSPRVCAGACWEHRWQLACSAHCALPAHRATNLARPALNYPHPRPPTLPPQATSSTG